jgi:hypothetical protein
LRWIVWFAKNFLDAEFTWSQESDARLGTMSSCHAHEQAFRGLFRLHKLLNIRDSGYMEQLNLPAATTSQDRKILEAQIGTFLKVLTAMDHAYLCLG